MNGLRRLVTVAALTLVASCSADASPPEARAADTPRHAVVLELFTSEGCSSCPPADAVLRRLAREQTVSGAEVIALELHVDYWNGLGWADPFSSPVFSARQRAYADAMGKRGVYTPQLVVDGSAELLGSHESGARRAIESAAGAPKLRIDLGRDGGKIVVTVPQQAGAAGADVFVGVTQADLVTAVPRGENAGATLAHGPVVRELKRVGSVGPNGVFQAATTPTLGATHPERARAFAFLQRPADLKIIGAASIPLRP